MTKKKLVDIAEHLEDAADALPDRHFSKTGELLSEPEPTRREPPPKAKPKAAPKPKR